MADPGDKLVTVRTNSRGALSLGRQVVGDGGSQKNRLNGIKRRLGPGWRLNFCRKCPKPMRSVGTLTLALILAQF